MKFHQSQNKLTAELFEISPKEKEKKVKQIVSGLIIIQLDRVQGDKLCMFSVNRLFRISAII